MKTLKVVQRLIPLGEWTHSPVSVSGAAGLAVSLLSWSVVSIGASPVPQIAHAVPDSLLADSWTLNVCHRDSLPNRPLMPTTSDPPALPTFISNSHAVALMLSSTSSISQHDIIAYLLFRKLDTRVFEHLPGYIWKTETKSDVLIKNLVKCLCCFCKDINLRTSGLLIFTVNNQGLHNSPTASEYCQMFLFSRSLFCFLVQKLKVSQVMTGLGSVRGKKTALCFPISAVIYLLAPCIGLVLYQTQALLI